MKIIRYIALIIFFVSLGFIYAYEAPKIQRWALEHLEKFTKEEIKVAVKAKSFSIKLFPPGVEFQNLQLVPHGALKTQISNVKIKEVGIYVDLITLLQGQLAIGTVSILEPELSFFARKGNKKAAKKAATQNFVINHPLTFASKLPIRQLKISKAKIMALLEEQGIAVKVSNFGWIVEKNYKEITTDILAPQIVLKRPKVEDSLTKLSLATRVRVHEKALEVAALKAVHQNSLVIGRAVSRGEIDNLDWATVGGRIRAQINLNEISNQLKKVFPAKTIPDASGLVKFDGQVEHEKGGKPYGKLALITKDLQVDKFIFGNIGSAIKYEDKYLTTDKISLVNSSGSIDLQDVAVTLGKSTSFSFRAKPNIELKQFLINLDVGDTPLHMDITGSIPCKGVLAKKPQLTCAGEVTGKNFHVFTDKATIVRLDQFDLAAQLVLDSKQIRFPTGLLRFGGTSAAVDGYVDFKKGFKFNYVTKSLNFADVRNLANLKFEGITSVEGSVHGDAKFAIIDMDLKPIDFWFEDYFIGTASLHTQYEDGRIHLTDAKGRIGRTDYEFDATVELAGPLNLDIAASSYNFHVADLLYAMVRKVILPFNATGVGSFKIEANGYPDLSKLSYKLESKVASGSVAQERYKEAAFNVQAIDGNVTARDVWVKKGDGLFRLEGGVDNSGDMHTKITGRGLRISDFELPNSLAPTLNGDLTVDMTMDGFILAPKTLLKAKVRNTVFELDPMGDSDFTITTRPESLGLSATIFDSKIKTKIDFPLKDNNPFNLEFEAKDWDFSNFLSILTDSTIRRQYDTTFTGVIDLHSPNGSFWQSNGLVKVDKISIQRGETGFSNPSPLRATFKDGNVKVNSFQLLGDNTDLSISGTRNNQDRLDFNVTGRIDLNLLAFLTPFFKDLEGDLEISTQVAGTTSKPDLLGSAYIKNGFIRLKDFPHPFEAIQADILFSQTRALINRLEARLGGGTTKGTGVLEFKDFRDIPLNFTGTLTEATLNVPEGLTTEGDLNFSVTGNWFPYLLSGSYKLKKGVYAKSFTRQTDNTVKRSEFLPELILQDEFIPLKLDLNVDASKGSIEVRNELVNIKAGGLITLKGDPESPTFTGKLSTGSGGQLFFNQTPFAITTGSVTFNNTKATEAQLYTLANTRVRDWDITLLAKGTAANPKITLTSTPPLSEKGIVSLLALGIPGEDLNRPGDEIDNTEDQFAQGAQIGGYVFRQTINPTLQKDLGVEINVQQEVDEFRNIVVPKFVATKKWTPRFSTSVGRTVGDLVTQELTAEFKLSKRFSVLGSYQERDFDNFAVSETGTASTDLENSNIYQSVFGLEFQYKLEFK